jgi:hypothetical protein
MKVFFVSLFLFVFGLKQSAYSQIKDPKRKIVSVGVHGSYSNFTSSALFTDTRKIGNVVHVIGTNSLNMYGYGGHVEIHPMNWLSIYGSYSMLKGNRVSETTSEVLTNNYITGSVNQMSFGVNIRPEFLRFKTQYSTERAENYKVAFYLPFRFSTKSIETNVYVTENHYNLYHRKIEASTTNYSFLGVGGEYYLTNFLKLQLEVNQEFGSLKFRRYTLGLLYNI